MEKLKAWAYGTVVFGILFALIAVFIHPLVGTDLVLTIRVVVGLAMFASWVDINKAYGNGWWLSMLLDIPKYTIASYMIVIAIATVLQLFFGDISEMNTQILLDNLIKLFKVSVFVGLFWADFVNGHFISNILFYYRNARTVERMIIYNEMRRRD